MHETTILCSWLSLVSTPTMRGSILPALMSATPTSSSTTFLFSSSASASAFGFPPVPSWPSCDGSTGSEDAAGSGAAAAAGAAAGGCVRVRGRLRPALRRLRLDVAGGQHGARRRVDGLARGVLGRRRVREPGELGRRRRRRGLARRRLGRRRGRLRGRRGLAGRRLGGGRGSGDAGASPPSFPGGAGGSFAGAGGGAAPFAPLPPAAAAASSSPGGAVSARRARLRPARQRARARQRRQVHAAEHVADGVGEVVEVRHDVLRELVHAHALHGRGHHHAGEARARLADVERVHRLAGAELHLLGQALEPRLAARTRRVAPEAVAERRVGEQPLDQLRGDL